MWHLKVRIECNEVSLKTCNPLPLLWYYRDSCTHSLGITAVKLPIPRYYFSFLPHYCDSRSNSAVTATVSLSNNDSR